MIKQIPLNDEIKKNIVFANHNLVTDAVFGEMQITSENDRIARLLNDSSVLLWKNKIGDKRILHSSGKMD